jgi:putative membrane protein
MRITHFLLGLTLALPLAARADGDEKAEKPAETEKAEKKEAGKLDDRQIATIALTAHDIDIHRAELALKHTKNESVTQFAQQMKDDHEAGKKEALALATKLGVKVKDSDVSKSLKKDARKSERQLKKLKGAAFDKHYIDIEVKYHEAVIGAVNTVLIPNAQNEELKKLLVNTVPTLEGHLKHAQNVQTLLNK